MCSLNAYGKIHEKLSDTVSNGSGIPLIDNYSTYHHQSISVSTKLIDTWLK